MLRLLLHLLRVHNFAHVLARHANRQPGFSGPALPRSGCASARFRGGEVALAGISGRGWRRPGNHFRARLARGQIDVGDGRLAGFKVHVEQFVAARYQPAESGRDWDLEIIIKGPEFPFLTSLTIPLMVSPFLYLSYGICSLRGRRSSFLL